MEKKLLASNTFRTKNWVFTIIKATNPNDIDPTPLFNPIPIISYVSVIVLCICVRKKQRKINMTRGPNKILLEVLDLTYLHKKEAKSAKVRRTVDVGYCTYNLVIIGFIIFSL